MASTHNINYWLARADKHMADPGSGAVIGCPKGIVIVPIVTATAVPSGVSVTLNATDSDFANTIANMDRAATTASVILYGSGAAGEAGGAAGGGGGGGGEYVEWITQTFTVGALSESLAIISSTSGETTQLQIGTKLYLAENGTTGASGTGGAGGDLAGSGSTDESPEATFAGGAGGDKGTTGGGGGGEAGGPDDAGNAGSNGSTSTGGAGGTGASGADGGAGGDNTLVGVAGTAPAGGGGGGGAGAAGGAGGAGRIIFAYTPVAESNTLAAPLCAGQTLILWAKTIVCNRVITAPTTIDGTNDVIALTAADNIIVLQSVPTAGGFKWQKIATNGPTLWAA